MKNFYQEGRGLPFTQWISLTKSTSILNFGKTDDQMLKDHSGTEEEEGYANYLASQIYEYQYRLKVELEINEKLDALEQTKTTTHLFTLKKLWFQLLNTRSYAILSNDIGVFKFFQSNLIISLIFLFKMIFILPVVGQDNKNKLLKGTIYSYKDNIPLDGATISDGNETTTSNEEGRFFLSTTKLYGVLNIKHLGYRTQTVAYTVADTLIEIRLEQIENKIQEVEVVSTGYQKIPKERATGSFEFLGNEQFNNRISTNLLERLDGKIPGLQYDNRTGKSVLNIRGINTLSGLLQGPLIIVDNFPFEGSLEAINPNDVESVTVLKDAAATSIWGARAGNGVIVISTQQGQGAKSWDVDAKSNFTWVEKPNLYYHQQMNSSDFIDVEIMLFDKGHYDNFIEGANSKFFVTSPIVDLLLKKRNNIINDEEANSQIDALRQYDYRNEVMNDIYKHGLNKQTSVSVSKRTKELTSRLSFGYDENLGHVNNVLNDRISIRISNIYQPFAKLRFNFNSSYSSNSSHSSGIFQYPISPGGGKLNLYPYARLVDDEGVNLSIPFGYNSDFIDMLKDSPLLDWKYRPMDELNSTINEVKNQHALFSAGVNYQLHNSLGLEFQYQFEKQQGNNSINNTNQSFYTRNLINLFTQVSATGQIKNIIPLGDILRQSNSSILGNKARGQINYKKLYGNKHDVVAFAGGEISHREAPSSSFITYGYDQNLLTVKNVDFVNSYPMYDGLAGNSTIPNALDHSNSIKRFVSVYFNGSYTYDNKYIVSASARRDAANLFGVNTNHRWKPLWSSGFAWVLSNEHFLASKEFIDQLKLRTTIGHSGNAGEGGNIRPIIINRSNAPYTSLPYAQILEGPNADLKWENVRMLNFGLDFSLFRRKIGGTLEFFNKKSSDLIAYDEIDPTTGLFSINKNIAEIKSRGFDITLRSIQNLGKTNITSSISLSHAKDIVSKYYGTPNTTQSYINNSGKSLTPLMDKVLYPVFSYRFAGLDPIDGSPMGYYEEELSKDYRAIMNDSLKNQNYHGSALPLYYGNFQSTIYWKSFDFSFLIAFKFGYFFKKPTFSSVALFDSWSGHKDYEKRWQKPGDEKYTTIPALSYPIISNSDSFYSNSDANIERGDLIRLQDIRMGYKVPLNKYRNLRNGLLNIFISLNNIGLVYTYTKSNYDPEYTGVPPTLNWSMGIKVNL